MDLNNGYFLGKDSKGLYKWNEKELIRITDDKEVKKTAKPKENEIRRVSKK